MRQHIFFFCLFSFFIADHWDITVRDNGLVKLEKGSDTYKNNWHFEKLPHCPLRWRKCNKIIQKYYEQMNSVNKTVANVVIGYGRHLEFIRY